MRTTITLDPDVVALLRKAMRERHVSFKEAVNESLRASLTDRPAQPPFAVATFAMGEAAVTLDSALQLAGSLEDEELRRRMVRRA